MRRTLWIVALIAAMSLLRPHPARAANFVVTNTSDCSTTGCGSFRDAVTQSNATPGPNTITFSGAATSGTIQLTAALPTVASSLTITGPGSSMLRVIAPNELFISGTLGAGDGVNLSISGLTYSGSRQGACIAHTGTAGLLSLSDVVILGCGEAFGLGATGLKSSVSTSLTDVVVRDNVAPNFGLKGPGVMLTGSASSSLVRVTITGNLAQNTAGGGQGGGLYLATGTVAIADSTIAGNKVTAGTPFGAQTGQGGGIYLESGSLTITNSTIAANQSSGGTPVPSSSDVPSQGGGIFVKTGSLTIVNSTISGNSSTQDGGGIFSQFGQLSLTNVTISGNSTTNGRGGGLAGISNLTNVTFFGNAAPTGLGGNIWIAPTAASTLTNTLIANASSGGDCAGAFTSGGHNIASDHSCDASFNFANADLAGANPQLSPLANNGGTTLTHLPANTSPAINRGTNSGCPATDQRGIARPQNNVCDVGAVEVLLANTTAPAFISANNTTFGAGTPGSFMVTTTGIPNPLISRAGSLPAGVTFVDNGNGTATFSGTPAFNSQGTYPLTITAANGAVPNATQSFTLTVTACGPSVKGCIPAIPPPSPPRLNKAFAPLLGKGIQTLPVGSSIALSFTINNPNQTTVTGVAFTDNLPAGLVVSTPNSLGGSCGGGTVTAVAGGGSISLTGGTLAPGAVCGFSVNVTGTAPGLKDNVTLPVTSNESGPGGTARASITVG